MTAPAAGELPFALDGTVTRDKLLELLRVQAELPWLDYKRECDLSSAPGTVEVAKDVGAMCIRAGYVVVGADDLGAAVGMPAGHAAMFDEATLSAKMAKYLPVGFEIRSAVHDVGDGTRPREVAVIWVAAHPDGWCVFTRDGDYVDDKGKAQKAFRHGDVYARHGTRSKPWQQADIADARARLVAREKDAWRAEHAEETRLALREAVAGAAARTGPSAAFTWRLDAAAFEAAVVELLRADDDVPVRRMLRAAVADAQTRVRAAVDAPAEDLPVILDRIAVIGALGLELRRRVFFDLAVRSMLDLYGWPVTDLAVQTSRHRDVPVLWLRIAERLYALGALAVRLEDWESVRAIALAPVSALAREASGRTWHRDALTQSSRARLFVEQTPDGQSRELSLLLFARAAAAAQPALRPDLPGPVTESHAGDDPILTSLCQFDLVVSVVAAAEVGATSERAVLQVSYPNFAQANGRRANGIVPRLVFDPAARQGLLAGTTDRDLARALALVDAVARQAGQQYWGWEGYDEERVRAFLEEHLD